MRENTKTQKHKNVGAGVVCGSGRCKWRNTRLYIRNHKDKSLTHGRGGVEWSGVWGGGREGGEEGKEREKEKKKKREGGEGRREVVGGLGRWRWRRGGARSRTTQYEESDPQLYFDLFGLTVLVT